MLKILTMITAFCSSYALALDENQMLKPFEAKGEISNFRSDNQKVTVINFWATWCTACKVELKEMKAEFAELFKSPKFEFAMIALDSNPKLAVDWVKSNLADDRLLKQLYHDPEFKLAEDMGIDEFPMTFLVDAKGKIVKIHRGFKEGEGSTKKIAEAATELLASP